MLAALVYLASLFVASLRVAANPEWNLDGVFYSALVDSARGSTRDSHARVYSEVEQLPARHADALLRGSGYRRELRASPEVFALQLPFYVNKPLYLWLGSVLAAAGVRLLVAPYAVSLISFALIGILLPLLAIRAGAPRAAALAVAALALWLPQLGELGALATPDALATALLTAGTAVSLSSVRLAAPLFAVALLARPDAAILALGLLAGAALRAGVPVRKRELLALGVLICSLAVAVAWLSGGYGWQTLMRHTFIERLVSEAALGQGFGVRDYFTALGRGLRGHMASHPARFLPFLALAAVAWRSYSKAGRAEARRHVAALLIGIWAGSALRFLAVPILADRFLAPAYVITLALAPALIAAAKPQAAHSGGAKSTTTGT